MNCWKYVSNAVSCGMPTGTILVAGTFPALSPLRLTMATRLMAWLANPYLALSFSNALRCRVASRPLAGA